MRFYYENVIEDNGFFSEKDIIKAIYQAWNIEADLYIVKDNNVKKIKDINNPQNQLKIIFAPYEDNEFNSELLKEYGYYMIDGKKEREIRDIKTNEIIKYDWSEVKQLI